MIAALVALVLPAPGAVRFSFGDDRLRSITIGDACILGDDVRTSGAYLIGSADGSDAQGRSVISVGSSGQYMKSDDRSKVAPPPFHMRFERHGANALGFQVSVGPVPQDFQTISFPFDFGLKTMDKFAFAGDHFQLFCSENDGPNQGSGADYDFIKPRCEIRDINQNLIGKVGGASTETPSQWAQVDGPYATVRVTVTAAQHYQKLVFMNHPGTHNLEFSFGQMKKGETASLSGEITVTPKDGPREWVYDAAKEFNHQIGRAEADGWGVRVGDERDRYMCFGPYATEIGEGQRIATFTAMLDNINFDNETILTFDVADATTGRVLQSMDVRRGQFNRPLEYQDFSLPFYSPARSKLEFRTLWHGISYARLKQVTVSK